MSGFSLVCDQDDCRMLPYSKFVCSDSLSWCVMMAADQDRAAVRLTFSFYNLVLEEV